MRIILLEAECSTFLVEAEDGRTILVQSDGDFPGLAATFGWTPCSCGWTDGTVDCAHRSAAEMIAEARDFLRERAGATTDDPGYF